LYKKPLILDFIDFNMEMYPNEKSLGDLSFHITAYLP